MFNAKNTLIILLSEFSVFIAADLTIIPIEPTEPKVSIGEYTTLACKYFADESDVYSVKWYKGYIEILRYMPDENQKYIFDNKYTSLKTFKANQTFSSIQIYARDELVYGKYYCEVSADAPDFSNGHVEFFIRHFGNANKTENTTTTVKPQDEDENVRTNNVTQLEVGSPAVTIESPILDVFETGVYFKRTSYVKHEIKKTENTNQ